MEKAILKTLTYADIFDYPLTIREIHKWLIGKKANLRQIEKTLKKLGKISSIKYYGGYYFLPRRQQIVGKRKRREKQSYIYIKKVKVISQLFKIIPWVKLVGVSGGLAMYNAGKSDDIDLFVITSKDRLWVSRLFILGLLSLTGQRRRVDHTDKQAAGKICPNTILEEDKLVQKKNIYLAHEVLQMKVLWQRDGIYPKYLSDNQWVFKYLPNWLAARGPAAAVSRRASSLTSFAAATRRVPPRRHPSPLDLVENLARDFQLKLMVKPKGSERVLNGAVYFHPVDYQQIVLKEFKQRIDKIGGF